MSSTLASSSTTTLPTPDPCIRDGDTAWVVTATLLVLVMMPGLALFEAGLLRSKNTVSVLTQVFCGTALMGLLWYIVGFSLVFGDTLGGFIGSPATYPALYNVPDNGCFPDTHVPGLAYATFQMMFASITPLLMTGAYAERMLWTPFVIFTILWEILVYYPVAHWIWGTDGWMKQLGVLDYAGGIVIHVTAGVSALVSAHLVHPRAGFEQAHGHFEQSSLPLTCVGGALLWMGWFGFNAGSALSSTYIAASVVANTQIASTSSSVVWLLLAWKRSRPNVEDLLNGAIAGLAGITPAAGYVSTLSAMVIGIIIGLVSFFSVGFFKYRLHIDDALDVSSVHGIPGVIGALAIGFCASFSINPDKVTSQGIIYRGDGTLLGYQAMAVVICGVWSGVWTWILLSLIKCFIPLSTRHRHDHVESDHRGLDDLEHDCTAYGQHSHPWIPSKSHSESSYDSSETQGLLRSRNEVGREGTVQ